MRASGASSIGGRCGSGYGAIWSGGWATWSARTAGSSPRPSARRVPKGGSGSSPLPTGRGRRGAAGVGRSPSRAPGGRGGGGGGGGGGGERGARQEGPR